jgi:sulfiredoxin
MSENKSVHSAGIEEIYTMPISEIKRPIPSVLDTEKVNSIAETLVNDPNSVPPLDVRGYSYFIVPR